MKMLIPKYCLIVLAICVFSCSKKDDFGPLTDSKTDIPVTVANPFDYLPSATVRASKTENKITITLQIPEASGRTIKEITKVAAAATSNYTVIYNSSTVGASALYTNVPIPGTGTSATFTTTFTEYKTKTNTAADPGSNALLARDFYFMITLDNGQTLFAPFVRVWVVD